MLQCKLYSTSASKSRDYLTHLCFTVKVQVCGGKENLFATVAHW